MTTANRCDRNIHTSAELEAAAEHLSRFHRGSWRTALAGLALPAFRLHRLRTAHDRVLRDALSRLDCPEEHEGES